MKSVRVLNREAAQEMIFFSREAQISLQLGIMFYTEICIIFGNVNDFLL